MSTTFVLPVEQEVIDVDMPPSVAIGFSIFLGACMAGYSLYDLYLNQKESEKKLKEYEERLAEVENNQEKHDETLQEHEFRIREKKDYDDSEEVEEGKYQGWKGETSLVNSHLFIKIVREKSSTIKKNQGWVNCSATEDASCVVRDFYLGNSHPDFQWSVKTSETSFEATVTETMVNGWDSIIKLNICILSDNISYLSSYLNKDSDDVQVLCNAYLKKLIDSKIIQWSRILIQN